MTCKQWDVAVVPFPYSDQPGTKRRPALVLSDRSLNIRGHTILVMVTTSWPGDVALSDHKAAGLNMRCIVRLKLFTLDNRLLMKRIASLSVKDQKQLQLAT